MLSRCCVIGVTALLWLCCGMVAAGRAAPEPLVIEPGEKQTLSLALPTLAEGRDAVLVFRARLDTPTPSGYTHALRVSVGGTPLEGHRLMKKPMLALTRLGHAPKLVAGDRILLHYAPDFTSADGHPRFALQGGYKASEFEFRVTDLVQSGENTVVFEHDGGPQVRFGAVVDDAEIVLRDRPTKVVSSVEEPLQLFEPRPKPETEYQTRPLPEARIEVTVGGEAYVVQSHFSTPKAQWVHGDNQYFRHQREVEQTSELIIVRDTLINLTDENLPIITRHEAVLGDRLQHVWLGGLEWLDRDGSAENVSNPTSLGVGKQSGIGLLPLDDVFRVHASQHVGDGLVGIGDRQLVVRPKAQYTAEWAIVPVDAADYWRFLNAARRLVDANFTIPGGFCFLRITEPVASWSEERVAKLLRYKDPLYACANLSRHNKEPAHGSAFHDTSRDVYRNAFEQRRRVAPWVKNLVYFHCFLDVAEDAPRRYADARILLASGIQANYGRPTLDLFFPTQANSYGPVPAKNVAIILDEIGADGVYWDEHEYSAYLYHYGPPWDGVSADINPETMTIARLKSSVTLITEPWRLAMAKHILSRGPLVGNSVPITRAMAALKFPCFVETKSPTNCAHAHLYSPIMLGDHHTEKNENDAYRNMLSGLDYGCVYHWYDDVPVVPTHRHLSSYMFPITPVELHEGFIIGNERIITRRSGLFGWGDASTCEVHVFNHEGREVEDFTAPRVQRDGKHYTELRLPESWSAALVRKF